LEYKGRLTTNTLQQKNKLTCMSQQTEQFKLDISKPTQDFYSHLTPDNQRILFSGPFGSGKTTFLREYFKELENKNVIHLYPVNYSVAFNQDIFELIKHDILFELLHKNLDYVQHTFSKLLTTQMFLQNNAFELVKQVVANFGAVGKSISGIADEMMKFIKKNDEFHKASQVDQKAEIVAYLKAFTKKEGSVHEEDVYTETIRELVDQLKEKNPKQETVLIIDDLDRIDPEHIFRLLNVFSAHFDLKTGMPNKFGFDKVILVCDINNIRNIFHAKYGTDVDFSGYIDKFYSKEIFVFDNRAVVENNINILLKSVKVEGAYNNYFKVNEPDNPFHEGISYIISGMVKTNAINLRSLIPSYDQPYNVKTYKIRVGNMYDDISNVEISLIMIFDFLRYLLGDSKNLKNALIKCSEQDLRNLSSRYDDDNSYKMARVVTVLELDRIGYREFKAKAQVQEETIFRHISDFIFKYKVGADPRMRIYHIINMKIVHADGDVNKKKFNYFQFLLEAFEVLQKHGLYKD
jgi:GTPase SAR1 family protein